VCSVGWTGGEQVSLKPICDQIADQNQDAEVVWKVEKETVAQKLGAVGSKMRRKDGRKTKRTQRKYPLHFGKR